MRSVYIVFSATPYKMGQFIRAVLRTRYNHVALSFDADLATMYTFARFHINTPFYGGFVSESLCRYQSAGKDAQLMVCRLPVPEGRYLQFRRFVSQMERSSDRYIYNIYSAVFSLLHIRLLIRDSYTCTEFVGDALSIAGLQLPRGAFHSLTQLERLLASHVVYQGPCAGYNGLRSWGSDQFPQRMSRVSGAVATVSSLGRLTARGFAGLCSHVKSIVTQKRFAL